MKPAFALSFSENGISLHHQSDGEWYSIGSVPLDAPDLNDRIRALRDQGFALENDLSCTLVIPPDQVRLLSIDSGDLDAPALEQKVREALEEATPYDLSELAYTTSTEGTVTQVAAVARQTLDEAQAFAANYGFVPQAFIASVTDEDALTGPSVALAAPPDERAVAVETAPEPEVAPEEAQPEPETVAEEPAESPVPIHPIAQAPDPDAFRPQIASEAHSASNGAEPFDLKRIAIPAIAASVVLGMSVGAWSLMRSNPEPNPPSESIELTQPAEDRVATVPQPEAPAEPVEEQPNLSDADSAILEALKVEPEVVQDIATDSDPALTEDEVITLSPTDEAILEALAGEPDQAEDIPVTDAPQTVFRDFTGTAPETPAELSYPVLLDEDELYLSSIDRSDLSQDAVALPEAESLNTDAPFRPAGLSAPSDQPFDLDERGLVKPSPEGTLNPDGILVFEGAPPKAPPEPPVRFEDTPEADESDNPLAGYRPRARPDNLVDQFERQQLGGRSREELAVIRPKLRPKSIENRPVVDHTPTALAVVRVPRPKTRPAGLAARIAQPASSGNANLGSTANVTSNSDEAGSFQPKAVSPKIPTTASVARQATLDNAINLRKLNLIGVYGTPANRRALVRLPSGRYKKLKVGDRVDGGNVVAIGDSELRYQKQGKNVTLKMPRG